MPVGNFNTQIAKNKNTQNFLEFNVSRATEWAIRRPLKFLVDL